MKLAIISDIHANYEALDSVLEDIDSKGVSQILCLGDIVGYGPDPLRCVTRIQSLGCPVIRGNHDHDAANDRPLDNLNDTARLSLEWTRKELSSAQREWLGSLPFSRRVGRFAISHSSLDQPEAWHYIRDLADAERSLNLQNVPLCFIGHTHRPGYFEQKGGITHEIRKKSHDIDNDAKVLVNVGSVGQPRDGDMRASYVIFDRVQRTIEFQRVEYEVAKTQERIRVQGLPEELAVRLTYAA